MKETKEKKEKTTSKVKDTWEYKDRQYYLTGNKSPLTYTIPARHTQRYPLVWFDESKGYERELRYATNQKSVFVDEQQGPVTLKHIVFEDGVLNVSKNKRALQEFLSIHPFMNVLFKGFRTEKYQVCPLLETMIKEGKLGVKTKQGFYKY